MQKRSASVPRTLLSAPLSSPSPLLLPRSELALCPGPHRARRPVYLSLPLGSAFISPVRMRLLRFPIRSVLPAPAPAPAVRLPLRGGLRFPTRCRKGRRPDKCGSDWTRRFSPDVITAIARTQVWLPLCRPVVLEMAIAISAAAGGGGGGALGVSSVLLPCAPVCVCVCERRRLSLQVRSPPAFRNIRHMA
ncbi:hypothetical protein OH76DRAFT_843296 [Lentinus brumalis]|uniref:Uncharacterized protein n=1 Tax=Lentinus brumalis TaxID=2498619 RepID=A0A371D1S5_9APHY|nr:hypothetical protein OH76DRAFT_843296 [Polyporus brumalis]